MRCYKMQNQVASADRLVIAFRYDIHCSLALDHQQLIESLLLEILGKVTTFIPIPEQSWVELRQEYVEKQRQQISRSLFKSN